MNQRQPDPHAVNIARAVQQAVHPDLVILHGSRARGDHRPDSDVDLLVVFSEDRAAGGASHPALPGPAAARYMSENPPPLKLDIVSITPGDFGRFRKARQHIAGQADHWGIYMSDEGLNHPVDCPDDYPDHWPATRQRLENAAEWRRQYNDMVDEDSWNQKLMGFSAQQGVENALRSLLSAYNDPEIFRHDLNRIWEHYLEHYYDETDPDASDLYRAVIALLDHTTYPDLASRTGYSNRLSSYATEYRYNRTPRPLDRAEKLELQRLVNNALNQLEKRTHQISGTSEGDVFPDDKPWE